MRMRAGVGALLCAALLGSPTAGAVTPSVVPIATPPQPAVPATFEFSGAGWGHGVGLSQYGALGMAREGKTATEIVEHFYTSTTVKALRDDVTLKVNVVHATSRAVIVAKSISGKRAPLIVIPKGGDPVRVKRGDSMSLRRKAGEVVVTIDPKTGPAIDLKRAPSIKVQWTDEEMGPALARAASSTGGLGSSLQLRYGELRIYPSTVSGLEVVNAVRLHDQYLYGIAEVSSSWPGAALKAQVLAARSYALAKYDAGVRSSCKCHVYSGTSDQNFVGYAKEIGTDGGRWIKAVDKTAASESTGLTVTYKNDPIIAYYSASTGGRTQNSEDVWSTKVPYARSVDDHWSLDPSVSPWAQWSPRVRSQAQVAAVFDLNDVALLDLSDRTDGTALKSVTATSSTGRRVTVSGPAFAGGLGLPSRWVWRATDALPMDAATAAVRLSRQGPAHSSRVVVAGSDGPVVLSIASAYAAARSIPLLVGSAKGISAATAKAMKRLKVFKVYLIAKTADATGRLRTELSAAARKVVKFDAPSSAKIAVRVAKSLDRYQPTSHALVVTAGSASNAVAAAGVAGIRKWLLYVIPAHARVVPDAVRESIQVQRISHTLLVAGSDKVSDTVGRTLPRARRVDGSTVIETSVSLARLLSTSQRSRMVIAERGAATAAVAASPGRPVVWVGASLSNDVRRLLQASGTSHLTSVGSVLTSIVWAARRA